MELKNMSFESKDQKRLLYMPPPYGGAMIFITYRRGIESVYKRSVLWVISAFRTVSTYPVLMIERTMPVHIEVGEEK